MEDNVAYSFKKIIILNDDILLIFTVPEFAPNTHFSGMTKNII